MTGHGFANALHRLCLALIIALPISTPPEFRNNASYVFTSFPNCGYISSACDENEYDTGLTVTAWPSGFAFILSFLAPLWTIGTLPACPVYCGPLYICNTGGFDGPIHISEEASNARTTVPWAIVSSVGASGWESPSRSDDHFYGVEPYHCVFLLGFFIS